MVKAEDLADSKKGHLAPVNFNRLCWLVNSGSPWCGLQPGLRCKNILVSCLRPWLLHLTSWSSWASELWRNPPKRWVPYSLKNTATLSCHWLCLSPPAGAVVLCIPTGRFWFQRLRRPRTHGTISFALEKGWRGGIGLTKARGSAHGNGNWHELTMFQWENPSINGSTWRFVHCHVRKTCRKIKANDG